MRRNHTHQILCYSDCLVVLDMIYKPLSLFHKYVSLIQNIRDKLQLEWSVTMKHTLREGNATAVFIAKLGASSAFSLRTFDSPPPAIVHLLLVDASRVAFLILQFILVSVVSSFFPLFTKKKKTNK